MTLPQQANTLRARGVERHAGAANVGVGLQKSVLPPGQEEPRSCEQGKQMYCRAGHVPVFGVMSATLLLSTRASRDRFGCRV